MTTPDLRLAIGDLPSDPAADTTHLHQLADNIRREERRVLGFPGNLDFSLENLAPLLGVFFNNLGDPYSPDAANLNAKPYEVAVLEYFAAVAGAQPREVYGYVASSSSEALLHGLATARRMLPAAYVYASDQAHYSIRRACELLGMELVTVASCPNGTMNPEDLRVQALRRRRAGGAIVVATCGTTMLGAVDDITALRAAASAAGEVYVHVDAAGGGLVAAHTHPQPNWSFAHGADSLNVSGHKILGMPVPAGISLVRHELLSETAGGEYIAATDRTLACSRSGLASLLLWARLRSLGRTGMAALVGRCQEVAVYAVDRLERAGADPGLFPGSLTVTLTRPPTWVVGKWHLACAGERAHLVTVGHVTYAAVDEFAADVAAARCELLA
ncbi:aminotransferase class V-fold PLP-dependent enzyme [Streptomyces xinghaiensis]|uniref:Aminotransferase class V-fold PLP-dependent enzyme n=1 Tax=Streptomyces xinghaiensis TaxID=1038928 RepID=A0A3M8EX99_9ACTN|nr:aminotransferase class V-fold PLP-dependent enzyme [Streptomyces xinghaiensis]RKM92666.1 aminotransferase class V-fold PLP-dependent enzyme [Streptomyces xinghaiensis]RNC70635.1 aminotransferase class V-fold PLP-dependent enzyme [Streptomyces xinghaiensis]